jgi:hypothetical protein
MNVVSCAIPLIVIGVTIVLGLIITFIIKGIEALQKVEFRKPSLGTASVRWGFAVALIVFLWLSLSNIRIVPCNKVKTSACNCGQKKAK